MKKNKLLIKEDEEEELREEESGESQEEELEGGSEIESKEGSEGGSEEIESNDHDDFIRFKDNSSDKNSSSSEEEDEGGDKNKTKKQKTKRKKRETDIDKVILDFQEMHEKLKKITTGLLDEYNEAKKITQKSEFLTEKVEKNPIPKLSKKATFRKKKSQAQEKKKLNFHFMPNQNLDYHSDLVKDKKLLELRNILGSGKPHSTVNSKKDEFQIGTLIEGNFEHSNNKLTKKERKQNLSQEWLQDPQIVKKIKLDYEKITSGKPKMTLSEYFKRAQGRSKENRKRKKN